MQISEKVIKAIYQAIDEVNSLLPDSQKIVKSIDTALYGRNGHLDSLGLVNFIVAVEKNLSKEFGLKMKLDDERAVSHHSSPFISVQALTNYIVSRLEEDKAAQQTR